MHKPVLLTAIARRRAIQIWRERARDAWQALGRLFLAAREAERAGHGDPGVTRRWRGLIARVHSYIERCNATLAALKPAS